MSAASQEKICAECGYTGHPQKIPKGSTKMELFVWFVLLIPGPIYSIWRRVGRSYGCGFCKGNLLLPLYSRGGQELMQQFYGGKELPDKALKPLKHTAADAPIDLNHYRF
jgi:hypothetical protein